MNFPLMIGGILGGLILMSAGSYALVYGASGIAKHYGISEFVIGATIVALGTSLPELITVIVASAQGKQDIGIGNIAGSNIQNVLIILGTAVLIMEIPVPTKVNIETIVFLVGATTYLLFALLFRHTITRIDGALLLSAGLIFGYLSLKK